MSPLLFDRLQSSFPFLKPFAAFISLAAAWASANLYAAPISVDSTAFNDLSRIALQASGNLFRIDNTKDWLARSSVFVSVVEGAPDFGTVGLPCSGVLVAPNLVLTIDNCLIHYRPESGHKLQVQTLSLAGTDLVNTAWGTKVSFFQAGKTRFDETDPAFAERTPALIELDEFEDQERFYQETMALKVHHRPLTKSKELIDLSQFAVYEAWNNWTLRSDSSGLYTVGGIAHRTSIAQVHQSLQSALFYLKTLSIPPEDFDSASAPGVDSFFDFYGARGHGLFASSLELDVNGNETPRLIGIGTGLFDQIDPRLADKTKIHIPDNGPTYLDQFFIDLRQPAIQDWLVQFLPVPYPDFDCQNPAAASAMSCTAAQGCNIRTEPSQDGQLILKVARGAVLVKVGEIQTKHPLHRNWLKICTKNQLSGWMWSGL